MYGSIAAGVQPRIFGFGPLPMVMEGSGMKLDVAGAPWPEADREEPLAVRPCFAKRVLLSMLVTAAKVSPYRWDTSVGDMYFGESGFGLPMV
jgi:hypothetical protein